MLWQNLIVFLIISCAFGWILKEYLLPPAVTERLMALWRRRPLSRQKNKDYHEVAIPEQPLQQQLRGACHRCQRSCHSPR
jgi:hypothetical protein